MSFWNKGPHYNVLNEIASLLDADPIVTRSYSEREKRSVWNKAPTMPGLDPNVFRRGPHGETLRYDHHGKHELLTGWDYGHILAKSLGGNDRLSNLRPERCSINRSLGGLLGALMRYQ